MRRTLLAIAVVLLAASAWIVLRSERSEPVLGQAREAARPDDAACAMVAPDSRETQASREVVACPRPRGRTGGAVRVQVVDSRGAGREGVAVVFAWRSSESAPVQPISDGSVSNARGMALVPNLRFDDARAAPRDRGFGVATQGLGVPPVFASIDVEAPPDNTIVLVLPPSGSVKVALMNARGEELTHDVQGSLRALNAPGQTAASVERRPRVFYAPPELSSASGPLRFGAVALGQRLALNAYTRAGDELATELDGPTHDGEEIVVRWLLRDDRATVTGCVIEPDGVPAAHRRFTAAICDRTQQIAGESLLTTDARGRFAWALSPDALGRSGDRLRLDETGELGLAGRSASASLALRLGAGTHDVGSLVLVELPVILTCGVFDEAGTPLVPAAVNVARPGATGLDALLLDVHGPAMKRWVGDAQLELRSGTLEPVLLALATRDGFVPSVEIPFARGTRDLRIVLTKGGSLHGRVLGLPYGSTLELRRDDGAERTPSPEKQAATHSGEFQWPVLALGSYTLTAQLPFDREPLVLLARLHVEAKQSCADPRLAEIDLRARIKSILVRAADAAGRPIDRAFQVFACHDASAGARAAAASERDGSCLVRFAGGGASFVISAPGYRPKEVVGASGDTTVTLEGGVRARARVAKMDLPAGVRIYCRATRRDSARAGESRTPRHQPGELVDLDPLVPGPYELACYAMIGVSHARITARAIEVLDREEPQLFELACTPAEMVKALKRLGLQK